MRPSLDLKALAARESEQVEWKENVADIDDVVATICAFANDLGNLGGGYVVCGAREETDQHGFPRLVQVGLTASRLKEVEGKVLTRCREQITPPVVPWVDELPAEEPDRRLLIFTVAATKDAHVFRRQGVGAHYVRIGRSTRQARNGVLMHLLSAKGVTPPWDERHPPEATVADLDLLAIRNTLNRIGMVEPAREVERYISATEALSPFVPPLCAIEPLSAVLRPRHFALALFGRSTQRFIPGAISYVSIYPGVDRSETSAVRHELAGTLPEQIQAARQVLETVAITVFDKESTEHPNIELYPKRALLEALVNAFAHRDYSLREPTRITIFADRIEFASPGGLPPGLSLATLRRARRVGPKWRNRGLAWFFQKLELAQAEGQGIATIRSSLKAAGCPPPRFEESEVEVICTLRPNPRGLELARNPGMDRVVWGTTGKRPLPRVLPKVAGDNPFGQVGPIQDPERFVGRDVELNRLRRMLLHGSAVILGLGKIGKTSLMLRVAQEWDGEVLGPFNFQGYVGEVDFLQQLAQTLRAEDADWQCLREHLESRRVLLLLDEIDAAPAAGIGSGLFTRIRAVQNTNPGCIVLGTSRKPLSQLYPEVPGSAAFSLIQPFQLGELKLEEAQRLLAHPWAPEVTPFSDAEKEELLSTAGRHPFRLQRAAFHYFESRLDADYAWHEHWQLDLGSLL